MKITKSQLRRLIKEEFQRLSEANSQPLVRAGHSGEGFPGYNFDKVHQVHVHKRYNARTDFSGELDTAIKKHEEEQISSLNEDSTSEDTSQATYQKLVKIAENLGAPPEFVGQVQDALMSAAADHMEQAKGEMVAALSLLLPQLPTGNVEILESTGADDILNKIN
jgi:hypothetical protein